MDAERLSGHEEQRRDFPLVHSLDERPTAMLITGDEVATGILLTAPQHGLRVPEDIAIIGFDNQHYRQIMDRIEPASENLQFKLSERKTV